MDTNSLITFISGAMAKIVVGLIWKFITCVTSSPDKKQIRQPPKKFAISLIAFDALVLASGGLMLLVSFMQGGVASKQFVVGTEMLVLVIVAYTFEIQRDWYQFRPRDWLQMLPKN